MAIKTLCIGLKKAPAFWCCFVKISVRHVYVIQKDMASKRHTSFWNQQAFSWNRPAFLADPGEARGCSTNSLRINSFIHPFPPTALRHRHAQTVRDSTYSYEFLNPEVHLNPISGSKVTAILLKGLIYPIGGIIGFNTEIGKTTIWRNKD